MRTALLALGGALGAWLVAAPVLLGHATASSWYVDPVAGLAAIVVVAVAIRRPNLQIAAWLLVILGFALALLGLDAFGEPVLGRTARPDEWLAGVLLVAIGLIATQLAAAGSVVAVDKDGRTLTEIMSVRRRGDLLAMRAKLLGSMPATIYLTPEELWKLVELIDPGVAFALPRLLLVGWWRERRGTPTRGLQPGGQPSR